MSRSSKNSGWRGDDFASREVAMWLTQFLFPALALLVVMVVPAISHIKRATAKTVVVYCAQDQDYAEPIFQQFQKDTGIKVLPVFDSEAVKTVGMANRLLAERSYPQCDLFWGNEEMRTRQLAAQNVFRETNGWAAFGHRSRRLVINTNKLTLASAPHSLAGLTNAAWRGRVALAYPQFGTTGAHLNALRQRWGDAAWQAWCRALVANKPFLVDGNSVVVRTVARGDAWVGLSDSDDVGDGQREGLPVMALPLTDEMLLIPNTVGVVRGAPHPAAAQQLFEWLQRPEITQELVAANALEAGPAPDAVLKPDWAPLLRDLDAATAELNQIFLEAMTKYAIIADIHANLPALRAVLQDVQLQNCTCIACLGDLVGYFDRPAECVEIIRAMNIPCVKGNHDEYCSDTVGLERFRPDVAEGIRWTREQISSEDRRWLHDLKLVEIVSGFTLVHATLDHPERWGYVFDKLAAAASFSHQRTPVTFYGHTHVPVAFVRDTVVRGGTFSKFKIEAGKQYFVNVGSVGQPRDNNPKAAYVIYDLDAQTVELRRVDYDSGGVGGAGSAGVPVRPTGPTGPTLRRESKREAAE